MLTEAEARAKECRIGGQVNIGVMRFPMCIASNCMHWSELVMAVPAYYSPVTGNLVVQTVPAKGDCGLKRRG